MTVDAARGFDSDLSVRWITPLTCRVTARLVWTGSRGDTFTVPAGFVTDLATSPRIVHWYVLPYGPYTRAAVLHDYLLFLLAQWARADPATRGPCPVTSRDADGIFRAAMKDLGTPRRIRRAMWAGVRVASLANRDRAHGRQFLRDLPAVALAALLSLHVTVGMIGVAVSLGFDRLIGVVAGERTRRAGTTRRPRKDQS